MDSLINRQVAVDVVRKCRVIEVTPAYILIDKGEAVSKLVMLPSAQPEVCEDAVSRADVEIEVANLLKCVFVEYEDIAKKVATRLPSVTPQRKTGKWIDQKGGGCCCSECGRYALDEVDGNFIHVAAKSKYCPNCGLKMEE